MSFNCDVRYEEKVAFVAIGKNEVVYSSINPALLLHYVENKIHVSEILFIISSYLANTQKIRHDFQYK